MAVQGQVIVRTVGYDRGMTLANRLKMYAEREQTSTAPAEEQPKQAPKKQAAASRKRKDND